MMQANITIVPFSPQYKEHIKTLNYEWLEKFFVVEPSDVESLSDPQTYIIDKGGHIFFAKNGTEIVGTSSLIKVDSEEYELAKMAVTEEYQGRGVGKLLLEHGIKAAMALRVKKLSLYSNTKLSSAIHLYKTYGFYEVPLPKDVHYNRADIKMEKIL